MSILDFCVHDNENNNDNNNKMNDNNSQTKKSQSAIAIDAKENPCPSFSSNCTCSDLKQDSAASTSTKPCFPLYLQHEGHSRTIIGMMRHKKTGMVKFLILDPSIRGGGKQWYDAILRSENKLGVFAKSVKQLRAMKYQVICIPLYGIMSKFDSDQSKTLLSLNVPPKFCSDIAPETQNHSVNKK
ncbi:hypothetical protein RFI_17301 [Reticulomyxa filosa]|uniref:UFSP1/2/DUB catalytic domain-containing protein n=1 Tax=Reticulomyxa filosa TaxID=46433 RepID=X6N2H1_RETFI|nr:hypothetical protein RFI_17301 [Reticulomyxa filosa]|eukprot:ETO19919.1 hypothetical protein RFI_17301 [Reticulomyxa filosa]